jgi:hypothetical protein
MSPRAQAPLDPSGSYWRRRRRALVGDIDEEGHLTRLVAHRRVVPLTTTMKSRTFFSDSVRHIVAEQRKGAMAL